MSLSLDGLKVSLTTAPGDLILVNNVSIQCWQAAHENSISFDFTFHLLNIRLGDGMGRELESNADDETCGSIDHLCWEDAVDIMKWKSFLHYWPFMRRIRRWAGDSHRKGTALHSFNAQFVVSLCKLLNKQHVFGDLWPQHAVWST